MNRPKKIKLESNIHSGNYMTSSIHDQNDDEEMPIASPDANNEVPVNDIDQEDVIEKETDDARLSGSAGVCEAEKSTGKDSGDTNTCSSKLATSLAIAPSACQSISGGLTLTKQNPSLKNLITYIRTAYSNSLTSPKWKNFKGLKLQVMEKIRLNNVIWRTWFEQYGLKNANKRKRPLICQFAISLDEPKQAKVDVKIDRSFWKKRLDSITNEYKKWRELSRRQKMLKATGEDGQVNMRYRKQSKLSRDTNHLESLAKLYQPSYISYSNNASNSGNFSSNTSTFSTSSSTGANSNNVNSASNIYSSGYNSSSFNANSMAPSSMVQTSNSFSLGASNSLSSPGQNRNQASSNMSSGSMNSTYTPMTSSASSSHHHNPIAHKQMPYRMRSPSPGLFQDIDLYNFSSDTLFSTYYLDDPKDPILGTNPDLFQPDLMHLYPTFDFLDIDIASDTTTKNVNDGADTGSIQPDASVVLISNDTKETSNTIYIPQNQPLISGQTVEAPSILGGQQLTAIPTDSSATSGVLAIPMQMQGNNGLMVAPGQPQQPSMMPGEYNDLSDFNTLATVAAAQTISLPARTSNRQNSNSLKMGPNLTQINTNESQMEMMQYQQPANKNQTFYDMSSNSNGRIAASSSNLGNQNSSNTIRNLLALKSPLDALSPSEMMKPQTAPIHNQPSQYMVPNNPTAIYSNHTQAKRSISLNESNRKYRTNNMIMQNDEFQPQPAPYAILPVLEQPVNQVMEPLPTAAKNLSHPKAPIGNKRLPKISNKNLNNISSNTIVNGTINNAVVAPAPEPEPVIMQQQQQQPVSNMRRNDPRKTIANLEQGKQTVMQSPTANLNNAAYSNKKDKLGNASSVLSKMNVQTFHYMDQQQQQPHLNSQHMNIGSITSESNSNSSLGSPNDMMAGSMSNPYGNMMSMNNSYAANNANYSMMTSSKRNSDAGNKNESPKNASRSSSMVPSKASNIVDDYPSASASRGMSRSNSYNSLSNMNDQNLSSAEQKRRCNIQNGFDRLQTLVPSLKDGKSARASKAAMLLKTSEYIRELQKEREKRLADLDVYKREIEALSDRISECQGALPANGVSVSGGLNKSELFEQKFNNYVKERTVTDWKFYLFSFILRPLFSNFVTTVNTSSKDEMEKTFHEWQSRYCSITQLRPIVTNALRSMSKTTSIITDPRKLREECISAALTKL